MMRPRVLLALTVYNGRAVVPAALASVARLSNEVADVDVLVLDDCSPEPGFSDDLARWCAYHGHQYYRSPRNLGIPRNVNLGLLAAMEGEYDHVVVSNSDVVYSAGAVDQLVRTAQSDARIGSVTAWSTNVSIYSIPNRAPDEHLPHQQITDEIGAALAETFGHRAVDIPAGISFAMLIPVPVLRTVGLMDPVFGRGYCEETDWSLRSLAAGFRLTLGVGAFVYHAGGGSTIDAGLLASGHTTVPANERIIDLRHPHFREQVGAFFAADVMSGLWRQAIDAIVTRAVDRHGYGVSIGLRPPVDAGGTAEPGSEPAATRDIDPMVDVVIDGDTATAVIDVAGFTETISGPTVDVATQVRQRLGPPTTVDLFDVGPWADRAAHVLAGDGPVMRHRNYPARV
jgi:GT2 family glycosyltransferase